MPVTGTETALASLLHANIKARLQAATGYQVVRDDWLQEFCMAVAESVIPHFVSNVQVNTAGIVHSAVPGAGLLDSLSGAVTGVATGTDTDNTTISQEQIWI